MVSSRDAARLTPRFLPSHTGTAKVTGRQPAPGAMAVSAVPVADTIGARAGCYPTDQSFGPPLAYDGVLRLQRTHGNAHVIRRLATIRAGTRGPDVRALQERLNTAVPATRLVPDGIFGPRTEAAVVAFQQQKSLKPDGIVGKRTWGALAGNQAAQVNPTAPATAATSAQPVAGSAPPKASPVDVGQLAQGTVAVVAQILTGLAAQPTADLPPDSVTEKLNEYFQKFAAIPVVVRGTAAKPVVPPRTVEVHTPYFINANEDSLPESQLQLKLANQAREQAAVKKFFEVIGDKKTGLGGWHMLHGKSRPEHIQGVLQKALDEGIIQPQDASNPTPAALEGWLRKHGVGVDCSGFVSQALTYVIAEKWQASGHAGTAPTISLGSKGLAGGSKGFAKVGKGKDCQGPQCLRPGDTMTHPGHVRVVLSVTPRDGGIEFTTLESRAGKKARVGLDRADWFYPKPDTFDGLKTRRGGGEWNDAFASDKKAVYGRSEVLAGLP